MAHGHGRQQISHIPPPRPCPPRMRKRCNHPGEGSTATPSRRLRSTPPPALSGGGGVPHTSQLVLWLGCLLPWRGRVSPTRSVSVARGETLSHPPPSYKLSPAATVNSL